MRIHIRRVVVYALGSVVLLVVLLNLPDHLPPLDAPTDERRDPAVPVWRRQQLQKDPPPFGIELQPRERLGVPFDERFGKYHIRPASPSSDREAVTPPPPVPTFPKRRTPTTKSDRGEDSASTVDKERQRKLDDSVDSLTSEEELMYDGQPAADNERLRAEFVHIPSDYGGPPLWWSPSVDRPDDRILAQMRHVPRNYSREAAPLRTIYVPSGLGELPAGRQKFLDDRCPVDACTLSVSPADADTADMRLLWADAQFYPNVRKPPGQIWMVFILESPPNTGVYSGSRDLVNWTATYRWDSTLVAPYEKFVEFAGARQSRRRAARLKRQLNTPPDIDGNATAGYTAAAAAAAADVIGGAELNFQTNVTSGRNYAAGKTKMVAWFVSNCGPKNMRSDYATELARYISVDVYGACGTKSCGRQQGNKCLKDYKFYLSFENSNCDYYITEKFFQWGLQNDVIPIVMGARKQDYLRAAPPRSYIHVEDFSSARELAKYLHRVDQSDALFNEYFAWKGTGEFVNTKFWCRLCAMLHDPEKPAMWYKDFGRWWSQRGGCRADRWEK